MKIKTFKYIVFYIVFVVLSTFVYLNIGFIKQYIHNFGLYNKIDNIKSSKSVEIGTNIGLYSGLDLGKYDMSNLYILTKKLQKGEDILKNSDNIYSYKDFYNLANIYFLKSYYNFKNSTGNYIEQMQQAISYYNISLDAIPKYKSKTYILDNLNLSHSILKIYYIYDCDNMFLDAISQLDKLFTLFDDINKILKKQVRALEKWKKYKDLEKCVQSFQEDANRNFSILYKNQMFFNDVNDGILTLFKGLQGSEEVCYANKQIYKQKYFDSINDSLKYFLKFYDTQSKLLKVFEKASFAQMMTVCNNKSKIAKNQNKENQKMSQNYKNLQDLTKKQKPKKKSQQDKKQGAKKSDKDKNNVGTESPLPKDIEKVKKEIEKQAKNMIEKIQNRKTEKDYSAKKYIDKLFREFLGNNEFLEKYHNNSIGK